MMSLVEDFNNNFKEFCVRAYPKKGSGAAGSYSNVIKYLFEFLGIEKVDDQTILEIRSIEPDILNINTPFYFALHRFFEERGQASYLDKRFLKAALPVLYTFWEKQNSVSNEEIVLLKELKDSQIEAKFRPDKLKGQLPQASISEHNYNSSKVNGTAKEAVKRIRNGRKAEKYFISFLINIGFIKNVDFFDVANNKNYGYDIRFFDVGLEIKNIKSGAFFLTDNEIARLENTKTHLILVDIDNGIWCLQNDTLWLKQTIMGIKNLRADCKTKYPNLDPCDIKIIISNVLRQDVVEISKFTKEQVFEIFLNN